MFEVNFYTTKEGKVPVKEFLEELPIKQRVKATDFIALLESFGNKLRMPYSRYIEEGIFELRIRFQKDISRVFYFFFEGNNIILTNGFIKKTQKTPKEEIEKAKKYKKDFEDRRKENE